MTIRKSSIDKILKAETRAELRSLVRASHMELTLPQAQNIITHADSLGPAEQTFRLGIIHTYTSDLLDPWLMLEASLQGLDLRTYHAPYGLSLHEAQSGSDLVKHNPDMTLLLLRREDLHPDLSSPLAIFTPKQQETLRAEVFDTLTGIVNHFRNYAVGHIALTILPPLFGPAAGIYDSQSERSESDWWNTLKSEIGDYLRESIQASLFLDLDDTLQQIGRNQFFDYRFWYSASFPFSAIAAREISRRVVDLGAILKFPKAKVIVLDADNTLWGGIIGEDGIKGIALGPEYPGNAFVDFQRRLLGFQRRGFILALCSKNNPADLNQVLKEHPHQILRDEHFAARRVNWEPKPENLISLAQELNLGLDSFVFVDDSDYECGMVRHRHPQVEVIQTPARPVDVPTCLDQVARLEVMSLTSEDLTKTAMYIQEGKRRELKGNVGQTTQDLSDYLVSLKMCMNIGIDDQEYLKRLTQLTQKTNQFNLTTRRYDEQQMEHFICSDDWLVFHFSLSDIFGDSGVVGLALLQQIESGHVKLDTFLMSCRVIGRRAEDAFLHAILRYLGKLDVSMVIADYLPTPKNLLVENFLADQGFKKGKEGRYYWSFSKLSPKKAGSFPIVVNDPA